MGAQDQGPEVEVKRRTYTVIWDDLFVEGQSMRSWGLFCYLMSRPPGWVARASHLQKVFKEGRDAIREAMNECVEHGQMTKVTYFDGNLRRQRYVIDEDTMNDNPKVRSRRSARETDSQDAEAPRAEAPRADKPPVVSTEGPTTDVTTTEEHHEPADAASQGLDDGKVVPIKKQRKAPAQPDPRVTAIEPVARKIVNDYHRWWKQDRGMPESSPLVGGQDDFFSLVGIPRSPNPKAEQCHHVAEALLRGYTEKQVKAALARWASGKLNGGRRPQGTVPSRGAWTEALAAVAAGRESAGGRADAYTNEAVWGARPDGGWGAGALGDGK